MLPFLLSFMLLLSAIHVFILLPLDLKILSTHTIIFYLIQLSIYFRLNTKTIRVYSISSSDNSSSYLSASFFFNIMQLTCIKISIISTMRKITLIILMRLLAHHK